MINGERLTGAVTGSALLTELYRKKVNDYPKFFKMDTLCRLGFVASELLLRHESGGFGRFVPREDRAVILFNRSGSLETDKRFLATIRNTEDYFPSPAVFVYTLPNIVTGEIAIRNRYYGETSFFVLPEMEPRVMAFHIKNAFQDTVTASVIGGWLECESEEKFKALLFIAGEECREEAYMSGKIELFDKQLNS